MKHKTNKLMIYSAIVGLLGIAYCHDLSFMEAKEINSARQQQIIDEYYGE